MERVFITGGSGSLGKALILNFLKTTDATVVCYSRDPHKQNALLKLVGNNDRLRLVIGDVRDKERLHATMKGSTIVIHAAALKHVDAGEYNAPEYISTNINGSINVADVAIELGVSKALFISTDKAAQPFNLYGRTKAVAERFWIRNNIYGRGITKLSCVRYGNVFDSAGSVMEKWGMLKRGDTITSRLPEPTRFICFLEWGVKWVRAALDHMRGGEIFVASDLKAISMGSLAEHIAGWQHVSIEPLSIGEKQHEILINPEEYESTIETTLNGMPFYVINPDFPQWKYEEWKGKYVEPNMYTSDLVDHMKPADFIALYNENAGSWAK